MDAQLLEYQAILDSIGDTIVFTRDRKVFRCNRRGAEMFGWTMEDLIGQPGSVFYPGEAAYQALGAKAIPILSAGGTLDTELDMARRDGSTFPARLVARAVDPGNLAAGTVWIAEDLTADRARQRESDRLARNFRVLFDRALTGILFVRDRIFVHANPRADEIFGWPAGSLVGQSTRVLFDSDDAFLAAGERFYEAISRHGSFEGEINYRRRDGTPIWCRVLGQWINPSDPAEGYAWIIDDVTEHRYTRETMDRLLQEYALIFDNAMVGISFQRNRTILRCNRRAEEIFGFGPGSMLGQSTRILFDSDEAYEATGRRVYSESATSGQFDGDVRYVRIDGTPIWVHITGRTIDDGQSAKTWVWVYDDITERRNMADALRRSNEDLELRVARRTVELSNATRRLENQLHFVEQLIEAIPGPVFYKNTDGHYLGVNREFESFIGLPRGQIVGKTAHDISPPDLAATYEAADRALFDNPGQQVYEAQVQFSDGGRHDVMFHKATFSGEDGCIAGLIGVMLDISALKAAQHKLDFQAHHDPLTGLPNRLLLEDRLHQALQRARRDGRQLALLFIDLDRFKNINDNLGHHVGDLVLDAVAARFSEVVRESDTVSRFGGDEFVVVLEHIADMEDAARVASKIIDRVAEPIVADGQELFVGASVGIALYPKDGEDPQTLLKHADAAMYGAKARGRNSYEFVTAEITEAALSRFRLEVDIRRGLEREEFVVFLQPQFSLADGRLSGAEALLRWNHPERGLVPPSLFVPLMEETGLIVAAGEWVLRTVCRLWAGWSAGRIDFPLVAVNVSGVEFRRGEVETSVHQALADSGLHPSLLELEITESSLMHQADGGVHVLTRLREMGIRLAVDDFGTGYSSLAYLKRLPLHKLKIDRSFVRDLPDDGDDAAISRAVISLAHNLQLEVIAEGVETASQRDFLLREGCDQMQGYLTGRPVPADEFFARYLSGRQA